MGTGGEESGESGDAKGLWRERELQSREVKKGRRGACLRAEGAPWAALVAEARRRVAVDTSDLRLLTVAVARGAAGAPLLGGILLDHCHGRADHQDKEHHRGFVVVVTVVGSITVGNGCA